MIGDPNKAAEDTARNNSIDNVFDAACLLVSVALVTIIAVGGRSSVRDIVAALFTVFVPGRAIATYWPEMARHAPVATSLVFSLTVLALVATVTLWLHFWHPLGLAEIEAVVAGVALAVQLVRSGSRSGVAGYSDR